MPGSARRLSSATDTEGWTGGMDDAATGAHAIYRLSRPASPEEWAAYHDIRRRVAFEAGEAIEDDPDEHAQGHFPLLFKLGAAPIGTIRVDSLNNGDAALRLVAIDPPRQREGHGRMLLREA